MKAIEERDIFKFLVYREGMNLEEREVVRKNITIFKYRVSRNIFRDEFYILYEAIVDAHGFDGTLLKHNTFNSILVNSMSNLMNNPNIDVDNFCEEGMTESEKMGALINHCMITFEDLQDAEVDNLGGFGYDLQLYLNDWAKEEMARILSNTYKINTSGMKVGYKFLSGVEDADEYYKVESALVKDISKVRDGNDISEINTRTMSVDELNERFAAKSGSMVSNFMIECIDEHIGDLKKGDLLTILGESGAGKSRMGVNIGYNALMRGKNVLDITLEGSEIQRFSLYLAKHVFNKLSRITSLSDAEMKEISDRAIFEGKYSESMSSIIEECKIDLLTNERYGKLLIKNDKVYEDEVMDMLEATWDNGDHFDVVIFDYVSLVLSKTNEIKNAYVTRLVQELKSSSMKFRGEGFLLVLPHQLTREAIMALKKGDDITIIGSADSSEPIRASDITVALTRDDEQAERDVMGIIISKARFAGRVEQQEIFSLHGFCHFADFVTDY